MANPAEEQTFVLADLAGYTALTEAHGDERAADVAIDFVRAVRSLLTAYEAEEVKALGDALLIRLPAAANAVELARRIVCELGTKHARLGVRVGVHTGTAVQREGDWFGSALNVAARVADLAEAGEVMLTEATVAAAGKDLEVREKGQVALKNVRRPVQIYALALDEHLPESPLAVDPVCHMALDVEQAHQTLQHAGATYVFCSPECAAAFEADPTSFARDHQ
jgi:class 3 adenylate cyclase